MAPKKEIRQHERGVRPARCNFHAQRDGPFLAPVASSQKESPGSSPFLPPLPPLEKKMNYTQHCVCLIYLFHFFPFIMMCTGNTSIHTIYLLLPGLCISVYLSFLDRLPLLYIELHKQTTASEDYHSPFFTHPLTFWFYSIRNINEKIALSAIPGIECVASPWCRSAPAAHFRAPSFVHSPRKKKSTLFCCFRVEQVKFLFLFFL